ncbi:hypothetical protein KR009_007085 [Drosophila setifemur]|nr:hypothetical protein KR009_007085 [Drosophila setifemur]
MTWSFKHKLSAPKISVKILSWMFYYSRLMGLVPFRLKRSRTKSLRVIKNPDWWKWTCAILRLVCVCGFVYFYVPWLLMKKDFLEKMGHATRLLLNILCYVGIVALQLHHGPKLIKLVNRLLKIFDQVRLLGKRSRQPGLGGRRELVLILLTLGSLIYGIFALTTVMSTKFGWRYMIAVISDTYVTMGSNILIHLAVIWYLCVGVIYEDLSHLIVQFRLELHSKEGQPKFIKTIKRRRTCTRLRKCFALFRKLHPLILSFEDIFHWPLLLGLAQNCFCTAAFTYNKIVKLDLSKFTMWTNMTVEAMNLLLLTMSVQGAVDQFKVVRQLMLQDYRLQDFHSTLGVFCADLNLYEFQVQPLGLFEISNDLFLAYLATMVTYFTFAAQYGMEQMNSA